MPCLPGFTSTAVVTVGTVDTVAAEFLAAARQHLYGSLACSTGVRRFVLSGLCSAVRMTVHCVNLHDVHIKHCWQAFFEPDWLLRGASSN